MTLNHESWLTLESVPSNSVDDATIREMALVARAGFRRPIDEDMFDDTRAHIVESEFLGIARDNGKIVGTSMARVVDDDVFNWMGCIIHPDYQRHGLGGRFMALHRDTLERRILVGHTRTPGILTVIRKQSERMYPIDNDPDLLEIALGMEAVSQLGGIAYQLHRYYVDGLYGKTDPADGSLEKGGPSLKTQFPGLRNPRNAVVVVARLR